MSIMARKIDGSDSLHGCQVEYYIACDSCGDEIKKGEPANIETGLEDDAEAFMLHKRCSRRFDDEREAKGLEETRWSELHGVKIDAS